MINSFLNPDGLFRLILDLRKLNALCNRNKFLEEGIRSVINIVEHKDSLVTLDITNRFYRIPVKDSRTVLLGFNCNGSYYNLCMLQFVRFWETTVKSLIKRKSVDQGGTIFMFSIGQCRS